MTQNYRPGGVGAMISAKMGPKWRRPPHWPEHWVWHVLPEDNGDPRLQEAVNALMDVCARPANLPDSQLEFPVLSLEADFSRLPVDHSEGDDDDWLTQVGVVRMAKAVLAVADRRAGR